MLKLNGRALAAVLLVCGVLGGCTTVPTEPEALPVAAPAAAQPPQVDPAALKIAAEEAVVRGEYAQAIKLYDRAVAANPRDAQALFRLGTIHLRVDDQRLAQYAFERALFVDPSLRKAYANLALVHLRQFRVSAERALASPEVSEDNRATLRSLMRDVDHALHPPASLPPPVLQ